MNLQTDTGFLYIEGVYTSVAAQVRFSDFEKKYLAVREKEGRVLSLDEIRNLPSVGKNSPDYSLWNLRKKNIQRFLQYISKKNRMNILDIGCGNGFFSNLMSQKNHNIVGVDINLHELKQAANA